MDAFAPEKPAGLTHNDIEITNVDSVSTVLKELKPDLVINTAPIIRPTNVKRILNGRSS